MPSSAQGFSTYPGDLLDASLVVRGTDDSKSHLSLRLLFDFVKILFVPRDLLSCSQTYSQGMGSVGREAEGGAGREGGLEWRREGKILNGGYFDRNFTVGKM